MDMDSELKTKISFHKRLFIFLLLSFVFFLICFSVFQYNREKIFKVEQLNYNLQLLNTQIGNIISEQHSEFDAKVNNEIISLVEEKQKSEFKYLRVTIIDTAGNVVFDTDRDSFSFQNHSNRPEISTAKKNGTAYVIRRHSETTNSDYFYSSRKTNEYIIRSAIPYNLSMKDLLQVDYGFLWFMLIVATVIIVVIYIFTQRLGQNIKRLRHFALRAERGEIISENEKFNNDELGEISRFIVRIYSRLQQAKIDLDKEKHIKHRLTQNINHELKTPVSSINGYLETILRNPEISKEQLLDFVKKSYSQADRLSQLLKDVATLTRIDEANTLIEKQRADIHEIILEIINDVAMLPADKRLEVTTNINRPIIVQGNPTLLHSIFRNLTDNAIEHSGGHNIFINIVDETENDYFFLFSDDGIGVEPKHLSRIFERFYRVDKGRSRKLGGTGLGLSIVKHAVIFHGGVITAKNADNGGLELIFNIKKSCNNNVTSL
ncbi:MAG: sensor histidine kinase [Bacteroidales bacterium]|jgi:signal transduction histidine kinase|nr:sensor histidine kinase [Bacteroidales bacterium]